MAEKPDGKVRVRCTGCGKRVKFPAGYAGTTFRCPLCHTTLVAPLEGEEAADAPGAADGPSQTSPATSARKPQPSPKKNSVKQPAIDRLNNFLLKEQQRVGLQCARIVKDANLPTEEKRAALAAMRHEKAVAIRSHVAVIMKDQNAALAALRDDPVAETSTGKSQIAALERELEGLKLYLKVMFKMRTVGEDVQQSDARQGTP